jgi:hypothetical protein
VTIGNNIYRKGTIMEKRMLWLGFVLIVVGLCSSVALAASMGPPVAGLEAGKWGVGLDYAYTDMTVAVKADYTETVDVYVSPPADASTSTSYERKDDFESNMVFVNLGYGVFDKLEVFLRLGFSDIDVPITDGDWDAGSDFAYGLGAKATFFEVGNLELGGLVQMTWASADGDITAVKNEMAGGTFVPPANFTGSGDYEWDEIKIAVGPSYTLTEGISIYGGPFYHLISGEFDIEADSGTDVSNAIGLIEESGDFEEESDFGFYIGGQIDIFENLPFYIEWQSTGDADVLGASIAYRF